MPYYYKPTSPRKTDRGLKARSKRGKFARHWWAEQWIEAMERLLDPGRLRRGRRYARQGQVLSIEEVKGGIEARVQGSRRTPYRVRIHLTPLSDAEWEQVLDALAGRALFSAQLLAGEMPTEIEEAFAAAGVSLFPRRAAELETTCSCPDWANPCKHVAAVHYILGEQFDEDPFLLFRLRGRNREQILDALRRRRQGTETPAPEAEGPAPAEEETVPLSKASAAGWSLRRPLEHFPLTLAPPATPLPALRRVGQPLFMTEDLTALLKPVYEAIQNAALQLAYEPAEQASSREGDSGTP